MRTGINVGDRIEIQIPVNDIIAAERMEDKITPEIARRYNGHRGIITRSKSLDKDHKIFEVEGAVSDAGIPFTFVRKWLEEVEA